MLGMYGVDVTDVTIDDSCVPEILLAYADGIEEHIKTNCEFGISRINNHDLRSQTIQAYCPHFIIQNQIKFIVLTVGAENLEFTDYTKRRLTVAAMEARNGRKATPVDIELLDPDICHIRSLDYSDPDLLQQILDIINIFFGDGS